MNCSEVADKLGPRADGELPGSIRQTVDDHLESCEICRAEAERLDANIAFLKSRLGRLSSNGHLNASFIEELSPRSRAEIAALEREAGGGSSTGRRPRLGVALLLVATGVVAWLLLGGVLDSDESDESRETPVADREDGTDTDEGGNRGASGGRTPGSARAPGGSLTSGSGETNPRRGPQPVRAKSTLKNFDEHLRKSLATGQAATYVQRRLAEANRALRRPKEVERLRAIIDRGGHSPRILGLLLAAFGNAPDRASVAVFLSEHLTTAADPIVRAGAVIGLCRPGAGTLTLQLDKGLLLRAHRPDARAAAILSSALTTESEAVVRRVIAKALVPAARSDHATASAILGRLIAGEADDETTATLLSAIQKSGQKELAPEIARWIQTLGNDVKRLEPALGALLALDRDRGVDAIIEALGSTTDAAVKRRMIERLKTTRSDRVFDLLLESARNDSSVDVRIAALDGIFGYGREKAESVMREAANDADPAVQETAKRYLEQFERTGAADTGTDR